MDKKELLVLIFQVIKNDPRRLKRIKTITTPTPDSAKTEVVIDYEIEFFEMDLKESTEKEEIPNATLATVKNQTTENE